MLVFGVMMLYRKIFLRRSSMESSHYRKYRGDSGVGAVLMRVLSEEPYLFKDGRFLCAPRSYGLDYRVGRILRAQRMAEDYARDLEVHRLMKEYFGHAGVSLQR